MSESFLVQLPVNTDWEETPPTIERPFLSSGVRRLHEPDGAVTTCDASVEMFLEQAGTTYRVAHFRHLFEAEGDFAPIEPVVAAARRIAARIPRPG